jgi:hypothetical protein
VTEGRVVAGTVAEGVHDGSGPQGGMQLGVEVGVALGLGVAVSGVAQRGGQPGVGVPCTGGVREAVGGVGVGGWRLSSSRV